MDELIESIRAAIAAEASPEARAAGASACRTILTALDAVPGQAMATTPTMSSPIATAVAMLRGVPPEQLLDLAIARLRAALPTDVTVAPVQALNFQLVPMHRNQI